MSWINDRRCPRCGCCLEAHLRPPFDYCVNCGRWTSIPRDRVVDLTISVSSICSAGPVDHVHTRKPGEDWKLL